MTAPQSPAQKAALKHSFAYLQALLGDPLIIAEVSSGEVARLVSSGVLIPAEDLATNVGYRPVPDGYQVVPKSTLERIRYELDELRTLVAEHLAGNDHSESLAALLADGIDVSQPFVDDIEPIPARPETRAAVTDVDDATPTAAADDPDAHRRPAGMPRPGEQVPCQTCGEYTPDPDKGEDADQALLSYIRWGTPQCLADHRSLSQRMQR